LGISTLTDLIGDLKSRRLVKELDPVRRPGAGRPTRPIALDGAPWCAVGVHVAHDAVSIAATSMGGEELWLVTDPVALRDAEPEEAFGQLRDVLVRRLADIPADREVISVEVALPGVVVRDRGRLEHAVELPWSEFGIRERIREVLAEAGLTGIHVGVANDCQLAGLYAARTELRLPPNSVAVYVGGLRGIGSGLIVDGQIFGGAHGVAGDLAHANVGGETRDCLCGRTGCLTTVLGPEALLSQSGLMSMDDAIAKVMEDPYGVLELLRSEAEAGNERVLAALADAGSALGRVIDDVLGVLNPHAAMVGGYVGVLSPYLREALDAQLSERLSDPAFAATLVVMLESVEPRVVRGAAMSARDACLADPLTLTRPLARA
jgi:predicted NBD/HSP70 family sugar kinase